MTDATPSIKRWSNSPVTLRAFVVLSVVLYCWQLVRFVDEDQATLNALSATSLAIGAALTAYLLYMLVKGRRWAWWILLVLSVVSVVGSLASLMGTDILASIQGAMAALAAYFLITEPTRRHLGWNRS